MKKYLLSLNQLYSLILFCSAIAVITLVTGFHMAWHYHENSPANPPVVLSHEVIKSSVDNPSVTASKLLTHSVASQNEQVLQSMQIPANSDMTLPEKVADGKEHLALKPKRQFAVQVGAFENKLRAVKWAAKHSTERHRFVILKRSVDNKTLYKVVLVGFDSAQDARFVQRDLSARSGIEGFIIQQFNLDSEIHVNS